MARTRWGLLGCLLVNACVQEGDSLRGGRPVLVDGVEGTSGSSTTVGFDSSDFLDACPERSPRNGSSCALVEGTACDYAMERCVCRTVDEAVVWTCGASDCPLERPEDAESCSEASTRLCGYGPEQCVCGSDNTWRCRVCPQQPPIEGDVCGDRDVRCFYADGWSCDCARSAGWRCEAAQGD